MVFHIFSSLLPTFITDWDDKKGQFLNEKIKLWVVEKEKPKEKDHWLHQMVVLTLASDLCSLLGLDDLGDSVVHFLDGLELGQAHATLV